MVKCVLCNKLDSDDSKDGIPIHKSCWYSWLEVGTHKGDVQLAIQSLHELYKKINLDKNKSVDRHKDYKFLG